MQGARCTFTPQHEIVIILRCLLIPEWLEMSVLASSSENPVPASFLFAHGLCKGVPLRLTAKIGRYPSLNLTMVTLVLQDLLCDRQ